ncbi:MAG: AmpG family muropeptide MFS transporter [Desulfobacterales bacterium]
MKPEPAPGPARGGIPAGVAFRRRMAVAFLMGVSCGLPLPLTMGLLQAWMKEGGVDLALLGMVSLVQAPYAWKVLWAPVLDRFTPPFLGRRRGWMLVAQAGLALAIAAMALFDPGRQALGLALAAFVVAFFSATQDTVVDAYRREDLPERELGLGSSLYVYGYRIGMWGSGGGGLILADLLPFSQVYLLLAAGMIPGILTTLLAPEPEGTPAPPETLREAVWGPLADFLRREGALRLLAFVLLYKIGDTLAAAITTPFYLEIGFSKSEIGAVVKLFGSGATIAGGLLGGLWILRQGIRRSLWVFGLLQAASTAGFVLLAFAGNRLPVLAAVIAFENLTGGMGTSAFVAFMASRTRRAFTATQYALLTGLMGIPRVLAAAPTGWAASLLGWPAFFLACTLAAAPGLWLLRRLPADGGDAGGRFASRPQPW